MNLKPRIKNAKRIISKAFFMIGGKHRKVAKSLISFWRTDAQIYVDLHHCR